MVYLKIADRKQAEFLVSTGVGEFISPYDALIEEYVDCALDTLEIHYNLSDEERRKISKELCELAHKKEIIDEEYDALVDVLDMAEDALKKLRGDE